MAYKQLRTPNLDITYTGGWCLQAVREAFGVAAKYGTAMEDWQSGNQHVGTPPTGIAVPVYFSLGIEPAGHVAISLPDGRVASSTKNGTHKGLYIHPDLQDLVNIYAKYNQGCTYLGWSTEVNDTPVIEEEESMTQEEANVWALTAYESARGGDDPKQWAIDRVLGGDTLPTVLNRDMPTYLKAQKETADWQTKYTNCNEALVLARQDATDALNRAQKAESNSLNLQTQLTKAQDALEAIQNAPKPPAEVNCQQRVDEAVSDTVRSLEANPWPAVATWLGNRLKLGKR